MSADIIVQIILGLISSGALIGLLTIKSQIKKKTQEAISVEIDNVQKLQAMYNQLLKDHEALRKHCEERCNQFEKDIAALKEQLKK